MLAAGVEHADCHDGQHEEHQPQQGDAQLAPTPAALGRRNFAHHSLRRRDVQREIRTLRGRLEHKRLTLKCVSYYMHVT